MGKEIHHHVRIFVFLSFMKVTEVVGMSLPRYVGATGRNDRAFTSIHQNGLKTPVTGISYPLIVLSFVEPFSVRFSTVGGEMGSADSARDPRGFAVKYDIVVMPCGTKLIVFRMRSRKGILDLVMNSEQLHQKIV